MTDLVIVGYGADGLVAFQARVPPERTARAMKLAKVAEDDPEPCLAYRINRRNAARLVGPVPAKLCYRLEAVGV